MVPAASSSRHIRAASCYSKAYTLLPSAVVTHSNHYTNYTAGASCEDSPLPEVQLSQLSIDNEDDTLISSADPAACDFLLVALAFQEQQSSLRKSMELQLEDPVVTVAVGTSSSSNSSSGQLGHTGSSKAGAAAAAAPVGSVGTAGVQ